jgi:hypothetical protein
MKNFTKLFGITAFLVVFNFIACKNDSDNLPQPHESTITAFNRTITVKGDASMSASSFASAKAKLEACFLGMDEQITDSQVRYRIIVMLYIPDFEIIIGTGNTAPNANENKSMTIGVDYLLNNEVMPIEQAIITKLYDGDFKHQEFTSGDYSYMGNKTLLITKYTGSSVALNIPSTINGGTVTAIAQGTRDDTTFQWEGVFSSKNLTSVTIPDSINYIGGYAFFNNQLTSVTIPSNVTEITFYAFLKNQLISITIGADVTIVDGAFNDGVPSGGSGVSSGFETTYNNGGKMAGTYTRPNTSSKVWTKL